MNETETGFIHEHFTYSENPLNTEITWSKQKTLKQETCILKMLRRGNLEALHPPIMPFKWPPFDLYNNVNIDTHHCTIDKQSETSNESYGKRAYHYSNSGQYQQNRTAQNYQIFDSCQPANSRSNNQCTNHSSCDSQQTTSNYITNSDNINSINMSLMSTIKLCENYRKLFCQSDSNQTNSKCERSQCMRSISDTSTSCSHSIDSDINCCCNTILGNLRRVCLDSMGDCNANDSANKNTKTNKNSRTKHYLHRNQVNHFQIVNENNSKATTIDENQPKLFTSITNRYDGSNYSFGSIANNLNNGDNSYDCGSSGELHSFNENETYDGSEFNSK